MAKLRGPANVYASIFYDVCVEENIVDEVLYEIKSLGKIHDQEIVKVLTIPIISKEIKKSLIEELEIAGYKKEIINLLKVLIDNNDLNLFGRILRSFQEIYLDNNDIALVNITLAHPMKNEMLNKIRTDLEIKLEKFVVLVVDYDARIIGGIKIQYNGTLIDNTIKKYTDELKKLAVL